MKRVGILLLQLLVTAAGLWYVFHDPQRRAQIAGALRHADIRWVVTGWICYSAVEVLATVRWQILLRIQRIWLSWLRAGAIVMIGLFFNQFQTPGKFRSVQPCAESGCRPRIGFPQTSNKVIELKKRVVFA
jgi:hypothetical protein